MKLALIADIHGNSIALDRVLADARNQSVQEFVILGDVIMMGPDPSLVLQTLHDLRPACWIKGNTDMWFEEITDGWQPGTPREEIAYSYYNFAKERLGAEDIRFISNLPTEKAFSYMGVTILCVHGSPGSVNKGMDDRVSPEQLELMVQGVKEGIIVSGHTHVPYLGKVNDKWIFNVGSVGRSFDGNNLASYGIIDFTSGTPVFENRRVYYPIEESEWRRKNVFRLLILMPGRWWRRVFLDTKNVLCKTGLEAIKAAEEYTPWHKINCSMKQYFTGRKFYPSYGNFQNRHFKRFSRSVIILHWHLFLRTYLLFMMQITRNRSNSFCR